MTYSTRTQTPTLARSWRHQLVIDTAYVATGLPLAVISFTVLISMIATGASLLITLVGLPVLVLAWWSGRVFAHIERRRIAWLDGAAPSTVHYATPRRGLVGIIDVLRDRQAWRDVLHGLLSLPITCVTWSVAVAWSATALFALPWPLFGYLLDGDGQRTRDVPERIGVHSYGARSLLYVATGVLLLVTLPFVLRGLAAVQARFSRTLLSPDPPAGVTPGPAALEGVTAAALSTHP